MSARSVMPCRVRFICEVDMTGNAAPNVVHLEEFRQEVDGMLTECGMHETARQLEERGGTITAWLEVEPGD